MARFQPLSLIWAQNEHGKSRLNGLLNWEKCKHEYKYKLKQWRAGIQRKLANVCNPCDI
jgi:hypothetical protein